LLSNQMIFTVRLHPGYHTGPGAHIGVLVGARHSHLDNAGYSVDQKLLPKKNVSPDELAAMLLTEERWRQILSSLVICFFAREVYQQDVVLKALRMAGFSLTRKNLEHIGEDIHGSKYRFKLREGFSLEDSQIPERILDTATPLGKLKESYIRSVVEHFKKLLAVGVDG